MKLGKPLKVVKNWMYKLTYDDLVSIWEGKIKNIKKLNNINILKKELFLLSCILIAGISYIIIVYGIGPPQKKI